MNFKYQNNKFKVGKLYKINEERKTSSNQITADIPEEPGIPTLILGDVDHQAEPIEANLRLSKSNQ